MQQESKFVALASSVTRASVQRSSIESSPALGPKIKDSRVRRDSPGSMRAALPLAISIQAVISITARSQRTWWRRIEDGTVRKLKPDSRGRAMIALTDVLKIADCGVPTEDMELLAQADAGDANAQTDIGEMFLSIGRAGVGRYWLELAAEQGHPNAMQCLARCYFSGEGVTKNEDLGMRWLADAAARGHVIAREQMRALRATLLLHHVE